MRDFNALERGYEAEQWNRYEAELNRPDPPEPTMIQRRQALMTKYCKMQGWPAIVAVSNNYALAEGASFAAALGYTIDKLPAPTRQYQITPRGRGVWNLTHRKGSL